jgi:hypothetical protein
MPLKQVFGGYVGTGGVSPEIKLRELSLLYNGLPTYSNDDLHILIKNVNIHTTPDTNLGLLPKPAGSFILTLKCLITLFHLTAQSSVSSVQSGK